jgi:hypothetical protein
MLGSLDRPVSPPGSRSRRMTHDDSVHIAATSPARRGTLARARRGDRASRLGDVVVSGLRRAPIARRSRGEADRRCDRRRNFPRRKALKTHEMAKGPRSCASRVRRGRRNAPRRRGRRGARSAPSRDPSILDPARTVDQGRRRVWSRSLIPAAARRRRDRGGNFPPRKVLKTHKTGKESRFCASPFREVPLG